MAKELLYKELREHTLDCDYARNQYFAENRQYNEYAKWLKRLL